MKQWHQESKLSEMIINEYPKDSLPHFKLTLNCWVSSSYPNARMFILSLSQSEVFMSFYWSFKYFFVKWNWIDSQNFGNILKWHKAPIILLLYKFTMKCVYETLSSFHTRFLLSGLVLIGALFSISWKLTEVVDNKANVGSLTIQLERKTRI